MKIRSLALGGAMAFAGLVGAAPALAFTHHPATPEEIQQTDALNAQSLANAQAGQNAQAAPAATPASMPEASATPSVANAPAATPLTAMASTPSLTNASVEGSDRQTIGTVHNVIMGSDGKPSVVNVALADNSKVVAISASELSYDDSSKVLVASLTDEQIKSLPAASG
jgi:hypothetical protein